MTNQEKGKQLLKEFEAMRNLAELKALSKLSLEQPLSDEQFALMKALGKECLGAD